MDIQDGREEHVPEIVNLLKLSLGESLMPKSESSWRWKHIDNPFGKSIVLLARENGELVGVRAFMKWGWKLGSTQFSAVRAVDTATHPSWEGKGIFKKLTLTALEQARQQQVDFVFNTPNNKSKPGYLKMGWASHGRLKLELAPAIGAQKYQIQASLINGDVQAELLAHFGGHLPTGSTILRTDYSPGYFSWRYGKHPSIKYYLVTDKSQSNSFAAFVRLKPRGFFNELRLCDLVRGNSFDERHFKSQLSGFAGQLGARLITSAGSGLNRFIQMKAGPEVTIMPLTERIMKPLENWSPTIGDLEVF